MGRDELVSEETNRRANLRLCNVSRYIDFLTLLLTNFEIIV